MLLKQHYIYAWPLLVVFALLLVLLIVWISDLNKQLTLLAYSFVLKTLTIPTIMQCIKERCSVAFLYDLHCSLGLVDD